MYKRQEVDKLPAWVVIIIIGREFIISGFRLIAAENGIVIAANYWGKFKTVSQMIMIILLMLDFGGVFAVLTQIFIWLSVAPVCLLYTSTVRRTPSCLNPMILPYPPRLSI